MEVQLQSLPNAQAQSSQEQSLGLPWAPRVPHRPEEQAPGSHCPIGISALARAGAQQENTKEKRAILKHLLCGVLSLKFISVAFPSQIGREAPTGNVI